MRLIITIVLAVLVTGCAQLQSLVPSFSDANQSASMINVRWHIARLDCAQPHLPQVLEIQNNILWFQLYSESKGARQQDVLSLIQPLQATVNDFVTRSQDQSGTETYCALKKRIMQTQAQRAAAAVIGRF